MMFNCQGKPYTNRDWLHVIQISSILANNDGNESMDVLNVDSYCFSNSPNKNSHLAESNNVTEFNRSVVNASFIISIPVRYNIGKRSFCANTQPISSTEHSAAALTINPNDDCDVDEPFHPFPIKNSDLDVEQLHDPFTFVLFGLMAVLSITTKISLVFDK